VSTHPNRNAMNFITDYSFPRIQYSGRTMNSSKLKSSRVTQRTVYFLLLLLFLYRGFSR
jgi:hypothetical protein